MFEALLANVLSKITDPAKVYNPNANDTSNDSSNKSSNYMVWVGITVFFIISVVLFIVFKKK